MYLITIYDEIGMSALLTESVQQIRLKLQNYSQDIQQTEWVEGNQYWVEEDQYLTGGQLVPAHRHWTHNNTKHNSEVDLALYSILLSCMIAVCSMLLTLWCVRSLYQWHAQTYKSTPTAVVTMLGKTDSLHMSKPILNATSNT